jgi:hypothetical protein
MLLVLSSLFLPITFQSDSSQRAAGWRILDRQEHWITSYASVGQSAAFGDRIPWLQPVFQVAGFSFYGVTVLATIAMLITLIALRLSPARLAPMSVFRRLTAVLSLASVWVLEDIHWGWHFDFSGFVYAALAATAFWLTMIVSSAVVVWRIAVSDRSPALISWLRLIQIPMIAFNLMFMRAYFEHDSYIPFTGLAVLLFGLPMLSWACQEILLVNRAKVIVTDARSKQELEPVTSLL